LTLIGPLQRDFCRLAVTSGSNRCSDSLYTGILGLRRPAAQVHNDECPQHTRIKGLQLEHMPFTGVKDRANHRRAWNGWMSARHLLGGRHGVKQTGNSSWTDIWCPHGPPETRICGTGAESNIGHLSALCMWRPRDASGRVDIHTQGAPRLYSTCHAFVVYQGAMLDAYVGNL
jgi:hypothetical protein